MKSGMIAVLVVLATLGALTVHVSVSASTEELVEGLRSSSVSVRLSVVQALGESDDESDSAVGLLALALRDVDPLVRTSAAKTLQRMGPRAAAAIPQLALLLGDQTATVAFSALQAIRAITGSTDPHESHVIPALLTALGSAERRDRCDAVRAYRQVPERIKSSVPELLDAVASVAAEMVEDDVDASRLAAVQVLSQVGSRVADGLSLLCSLTMDPSADVRLEAAKAIAALAPEEPEAISALAIAMGDPDHRVSEVALTSLILRGDTAISSVAAPSLVSDMYHGDIATSDAAAKTLAKLVHVLDAGQVDELRSSILAPLGELIETAESHAAGAESEVDTRDIRTYERQMAIDRLQQAVARAKSLRSSAMSTGAQVTVLEILEEVTELRKALEGQDSYILGSEVAKGLSLSIIRQMPNKSFLEIDIRRPGAPSVWIETAPWVVTSEGKTKVFFATNMTCSMDVQQGANLVNYGDYLDYSTYQRVTWDPIRKDPELPPPEVVKAAPYWSNSYYGALMGQITENRITGEKNILTVTHGENKNMVFGDYRYVGTVLPDRGDLTAEQFTGRHPDGVWRDYFPAYFGFIGLSHSTFDSGGLDFMANDMGPIVWPSNGCLTSDGTKASNGVRHPSMIVHDGYLYVFYLDQTAGKPRDTGRESGIKVARALINDDGMPGEFVNYFNGAFCEPSLPSGFNRDDRSFFSVKGGRSSRIIDTDSTRFSVAKLEGTPYFIAADDRVQPGDCGLYLRLSKDLVNWSKGVLVPGTTGANWREMPVHYPLFLNAELTENCQIDPNGFYVVGSPNTGSRFRLIYLQIDVDPNVD